MEYLQLEKEYSKFIETDYCITCNTGTSALHLALEALQLEKGDEIIVPEFTMVASAWAVVYAGLVPSFVDCDSNFLIDADKIEEKITSKTRAIMVTHVYGRVCDMNRIMSIAKKYKLRVIEDACEAQGAKFENKMVGSFDIGCFSFYRNKIICAEEGGAITTNDKVIADRCRDLKNMSFGTDHNYLHGKIGFNYRMTDSQARMILCSLKDFSKNSKARRKIENFYNNNLPKSFLLKNKKKRESVWVYDIFLGDNKDEFVEFMNDRKIAVRHSFKPMSMQSTFNRPFENLKAYKFSKSICYLPVSPQMTEEELNFICESCYDFLKIKKEKK